jgi:hypothetical protein
MKRKRVLLPWETSHGPAAFFARIRPRVVVGVVVGLWALTQLRDREADKSRERATRAELTLAARGVDAYRADHPGGCPPALGELVRDGYLAQLPTDGWGKPILLVCPGRRDPAGFDLASGGPDGEPWGIDRVE